MKQTRIHLYLRWMKQKFVTLTPARLNVLVCVFLAGAIFFTSTPTPVVLQSVITRDDWSGGVGTDANQYSQINNLDDSVPGALTLQNNNVDNWCNTLTCDSNWQYRQEIHIGITQAIATQHTFAVIEYSSEMKADFSDLRFVQLGSNNDLDYYTIDKVDGEYARVWLELTNAAQPGSYSVQMYYGNPSATSLSTKDAVLFDDGFDEGNSDDWIGLYGGNPPTVSNGVATFDSSTLPIGDGRRTSQSFSRGDGKTMQFDFSIDGMGCGNAFNWNVGIITVGEFGAVVDSGFDDDNINLCNQFNMQATLGTTDGNQQTTVVDSNQVYTGRISLRSDGGFDFLYSSDKGKTFIPLPGYDSSSNINVEDFYLQAFAWTGSTSSERMNLRNVTLTEGSQWNANVSNFGPQETQGGKIGYLTSAPIDTGVEAPEYQTIEYNATGSGSMRVRVKTSPNADMSGSANLYYCPDLNSGDQIVVPSDYGGTCATQGQRYIQYQVLFADNDGDFTLNDVTINFLYDDTPPDSPTNLILKTSSNGQTIPTDSWTRTQSPYVSWDAVQDSQTGDSTGLKGYCLYVGQDNSANIEQTSGLLPVVGNGDYTGIDTGGYCQHMVSNTYIDLSAITSLGIQSDQTYYFKVAAVDNLGNISNVVSTSWKYDNIQPFVGTQFSIPTTSGTKAVTFSWINTNLAVATDSGSGFAGFKYCVAAIIYSPDSFCDLNGSSNFYGANRGSGDPRDPTDVIPFEAGSFTFPPEDFAQMDDQIALANAVLIIAVDNAGNYIPMGQSIFLVTQMPASAPQNLTVTPPSNTANSFTFQWDAPVVHLGPVNELEFCWTVNEEIELDGANCNWTGRNVYSLAQGAYATKQGVNTLYIATKDTTGNFDGTQFANINFTATTAAPGPPRDLDSSDASIRATSAWKVALTWSAPTLSGSGVNSYKVFRSTDNVNFTEVGTTSSNNLSFVDSGLSQVDYYYYVKACDNANSCSVASSTVSRKPTGRFTVPPTLTSDTDQPKSRDEGTQKATLFWFTDRESDSKVAYGTKPGQYFPEEVGNSTQTTSHVVNLTNLEPNTKYYYIARWTDNDGNTGTSGERSFTTLPAPTISEAEAINIGTNAATITFRVRNASKVNVYYGENGLGGNTSINTAARESTYSVPLADLDDGSRYSFKLNGVDEDGNEYQGNTYNFTTLARPQITNLRFQPVAGAPSSTQEVTWNTNVPATTGLSYGPRGAQQNELLTTGLTTNHKMIISNLQDDTDYTLIARSTDGIGNVAVSDQQTFRTALDTRPPKISDVVIEQSIRGTGVGARGQIVVSWKTDEPATSQVAFGQGQAGNLNRSSGEDTRLSTEHTVVLSDLTTATVYRVQPVSHDKARNNSRGGQQTVIVGRGSDNIFGIILNALEKIFGLGNG